MKTQTMKLIYESPELHFNTLELEGAFLTLSGYQTQVDESISVGFDGTTSETSAATSDYYIDFN